MVSTVYTSFCRKFRCAVGGVEFVLADAPTFDAYCASAERDFQARSAAMLPSRRNAEQKRAARLHRPDQDSDPLHGFRVMPPDARLPAVGSLPRRSPCRSLCA